MAWESPVDRLILRQIHLAEKAEVKATDVRDQVLDLLVLAPRRERSAFHLGYAGTLLGIEWPAEAMVPVERPEARRWLWFGKLRAHERRGERAWVSELCEDRSLLSELLREPLIASQALPIVIRAFFWSGALDRAVGALELLSLHHPTEDSEAAQSLVEAALSDLIARVEHRTLEAGDGGTRSLLQRCTQLRGYERQTVETRSRFHRALARCHLVAGEWSEAAREIETGLKLLTTPGRVRSSLLLLGAMQALHVPRLVLVEPDLARNEGAAAAVGFLDRACSDEDRSAPEALLLRGVLAYGRRDFDAARRDLERCLKLFRGAPPEDDGLVARARFWLGASLFASAASAEYLLAAHLLAQSLDVVRPDLHTFYDVYGTLKQVDRTAALRFLDQVDVGRGTSADQILLVALEYQALGESEAAERAAQRVLRLAIDLDRRIEALKVLLTARNMRGDEAAARETYFELRELFLRRGRFADMEALLKNEALVGQALDHLAIKSELIDLYDEMEGKEDERVALQIQVARSFRARKDVEQLKQSLLVLKEVELRHPELVQEEIETLERLLAAHGPEQTTAASPDRQVVDKLRAALGHAPRALVVGGNERQRKHHHKLTELQAEWGFEAEWWMANYTSPQRLVNQIGERLHAGTADLLVLLHWNRHETTEPALELARKAGVHARTVYYAGFTSLRLALAEMFERRLAEAGRDRPVARK